MNYSAHSSVGDYNSYYLVCQKSVYTTGLSFFLTKGAVIKADVQFVKNGTQDEYAKTFNAGFGIMF